MDATNMTLDEIKAHLRRDYGFFECPKKEDRLDIPQDKFELIDWTLEEKQRNCALPSKMWNRRHDDHIWPMCKNWRGDDAYGFRAGEVFPEQGDEHPKFLPGLPKLVEGRGIARWMASADASVVEVPKLADYRTLWTPDNLPQVIEFYERKGGHPKFGELQRWAKKNFLRTYAPSSLQKFSKRSYLLREPYHISRHLMIKKREKYHGDYEPDTVAFFRKGWRWDSLDRYFVKNAFYVGLRWN